jgi:hypothetical protein
MPFTKAWKEHRKGQIDSAASVPEPIEETTLPTTRQSEEKGSKIWSSLTTKLKSKDDSTTTKTSKFLAQYPTFDKKWAVNSTGRIPPTHTPYPYKEYVGGERVLAQYGHVDNKWAAGSTSRVAPTYHKYPYREYVNGQRVLAQYGHYDNKWAAKPHSCRL